MQAASLSRLVTYRGCVLGIHVLLRMYVHTYMSPILCLGTVVPRQKKRLHFRLARVESYLSTQLNNTVEWGEVCHWDNCTGEVASETTIHNWLDQWEPLIGTKLCMFHNRSAGCLKSKVFMMLVMGILGYTEAIHWISGQDSRTVQLLLQYGFCVSKHLPDKHSRPSLHPTLFCHCKHTPKKKKTTTTTTTTTKNKTMQEILGVA